MEYLHNYRLLIARELLAHTGLTIDEIAQATGFAYGTYLIRRFTARAGESPTAYRQRARKLYGIVIPKT
jgi:transcriptional regulator GlxA family with amidase domain